MTITQLCKSRRMTQTELLNWYSNLTYMQRQQVPGLGETDKTKKALDSLLTQA